MNHAFIIGAQRSGTTFLANYLNAYTSIALAQPLFPEPKYFIAEDFIAGKQGVYQSMYFDNMANCDWHIEKSTSYYEHPQAAARIRKDFPDAKIIFVARNPVHRALSNYAFSTFHGLETRSIEDVFLNEKPAPKISKKLSVDPFNYLGRGEYARHLAPYYDLFGKKNIAVLLFEHHILGDHFDTLMNFLNTPIKTVEKAGLNKNARKQKNNSVAKDVLHKLYAYFDPHNAMFAALTSSDISPWRNQALIDLA